MSTVFVYLRMQKEIFLDIPEYEGYYQASNLGNIKRLAGGLIKNDRIMKPINNGFGYFSVPLCKNGVKKRFYIHRLVALSFFGVAKDGMEVNHIDGDKSNNKIINLEWASRSENQKHRYDKLGHSGANKGKTGDKNWNSKSVYMFDKNGIFLKFFAGASEAHRQTGIHQSTIRDVIKGKGKTAGGFIWKRNL